jgi:hypothetical protein
MLCSYRYYVRPHRIGTPPSRPRSTVQPTAAASPPLAPEPSAPALIDTPPHVAIVRQYAW